MYITTKIWENCLKLEEKGDKIGGNLQNSAQKCSISLIYAKKLWKFVENEAKNR